MASVRLLRHATLLTAALTEHRPDVVVVNAGGATSTSKRSTTASRTARRSRAAVAGQGVTVPEDGDSVPLA